MLCGGARIGRDSRGGPTILDWMEVRLGRLTSESVWLLSVACRLCLEGSVCGSTRLLFCADRGNGCRLGRKGVGSVGIFQGGSVVQYRRAKACSEVAALLVRRGLVVAIRLLV